MSEAEKDIKPDFDEYHTLEDLYNHRHHLLIALMKSHPDFSWRANNNADGSNCKGYFIAGMHLPTGDISYHMPTYFWTKLDGYGIATSNKAPKFDGHNSDDVLSRLINWEF